MSFRNKLYNLIETNKLTSRFALRFKLLVRDSFLHIKKQIQIIFTWIKNHRKLLKQKGKAHLTIMIIPQSEHKSLSWSISYRNITMIVGGFICITILSALIVLQSSSRDHQIYEFEFSNEDFLVQSQKMRKELEHLYELNQNYYEKVSSLHSKLSNSSQTFFSVEKEFYPKLEPNQDEIFPETYKLMSILHNLLEANKVIDEIIKIVKQRKHLIQQTPSIWPVKGYILLPFGKFFLSVTGMEYMNYGVDIATTPSAEVVATASGTVYEIGYTPYTQYFVKISHKYGWKTIYSNLDRVKIQQGQELEKGEVIGFAGRGRLYPTYMVHYEVHVGSQPLDPYSFLNQVRE